MNSKRKQNTPEQQATVYIECELATSRIKREKITYTNRKNPAKKLFLPIRKWTEKWTTTEMKPWKSIKIKENAILRVDTRRSNSVNVSKLCIAPNERNECQLNRIDR